MKVVLAGPSGSGKTTLAKALAKELGWEFQENSAGMIISPSDKLYMREQWKYSGNWGQAAVINYSHESSHFGVFFQESILRARKLLIAKEGNHVYDRSALDPMVFWLNQVVHNVRQDITEEFFHKCVGGLRNVDIILRLPLQNPDKGIEDNGSRVHNWYFQKKIDVLFDQAIERVLDINKDIPGILDGHEIAFYRCPTWDWYERLSWAVQCVRSNLYKG